jgi:hypothetical protein
MVLHHVAQRAGLVVIGGAVFEADGSATVICTWSIWLEFHSGS